MADYWKSQPRKQCDFCKCWIADNKPSIAFHEGGKKHKENVAKRLAEIGKKSAKESKTQLKFDHEFQKMEKAAMKAYMKDMEENADFTSQLVLKEIEDKKRQKQEEAAKEEQAKKAAEAVERKKRKERRKVLDRAANLKWHEASSIQGHTYYWNIETNESKWEPPVEGFLSIADQKIIKEGEKKSNETKEAKGKSSEEKKRKSDTDLIDIINKKKKKKGLPVLPTSKPTEMGPAPKAEPYGAWKPVETPMRSVPPPHSVPDLKLPLTAEVKPKIKFQEKTVSRLSYDEEEGTSASFSGFKKKNTFRGNVRKRLDTDD